MVTNDILLTEGRRSAGSEQAQYSAHRVFVMLFDEGHLANDSLMRVKIGAEKFVREMFHEGTPAACSSTAACTRAG
jgi:hypothetical protein